jgi:hypothetical protein
VCVPTHRPEQYAFEDFAIRQVALLLNNTSDAAKYANRSLVSPALYVFSPEPEISHQSYRNVWDPDLESDGFRGEESFYVYLCHSDRRVRFHAETLPKWNFRGSGPCSLLGSRPRFEPRMLFAK